MTQHDVELPAPARVECRAAATYNPEEAFVIIDALGSDRPLPFIVDIDLVDPRTLPPPTGQDVDSVDASVEVRLLARNNGHVTIEVPGEPISFGPRIEVLATKLR